MGVVAIGLVCCLMALALLICARQAEVAKVGYEIVALRKELAVLQAEYQRLEVQVARLQSFDRIEGAAAKLGMARPQEVRLVYSEEPSTAPKVEVAATPSGPRQWLSAIVAAVVKLGSGVVGAEARTLK